MANKIEQYISYNDLGSFETHLIESIMVADMSNLKRIAKGFPQLVNDYLITMQWCKNDIEKITGGKLC